MGFVINSTPRPHYPRERPGTHCIGDRVGLRTGLDWCGKSHPHRDSIRGPSSTVASCYTDWAIPPPKCSRKTVKEKYSCIMGCYSVYIEGNLPTFRRDIVSPSTRWLTLLDSTILKYIPITISEEVAVNWRRCRKDTEGLGSTAVYSTMPKKHSTTSHLVMKLSLPHNLLKKRYNVSSL